MPDTELDADQAPTESDREYWERYDIALVLDNPGDSRAVALGCMSPEPQRVLELGCSTGVMTKEMAGRGHQVTAVEIDPVAARFAASFADEILVGDLDRVDSDGRHLLSDLDAGSFDTLIAADVLEHLRDPAGCLRRVRELMKPDGRYILSIPNVAHADVRLALLAGNFDYQDSGLLDRTHTQLFTLKALVGMIRDVGLAPVEWKRVHSPIGDAQVDIDENLLEFGRRILSDDPEAETFQWIVTCQDAAAAGSNADWPVVPDGEAVAAQVIGMMNAPVAHPGPANVSDAPEVVEAASPVGFNRRLRRFLGSGRDRLVARLVR